MKHILLGFGLLLAVAACDRVKLPSNCPAESVLSQECGYCTADGACFQGRPRCVPQCKADADCPEHAFDGCDDALGGCIPKGNRGCEPNL